MEFYEIQTMSDICSIFGVSERFLHYHLDLKPKQRYRRDTIPKKDGTLRTIYIPRLEYKAFLFRVKNVLQEVYDPLDCVHGFCPQKSILTNANPHTGKDFILNIDLVSFFDAFNFGRVRGYFLEGPFKFNNLVSTVLAKILTYEDTLPMGSPTSPIIANMIAFSLDVNLLNYCGKYSISYTRYADDLTFSCSKSHPPRGFLELDGSKYFVGKTIKKIIKNEGFEIKDNKTYIARKYSRQLVTNLVVNDRVNLKREYIRKIRAILHNIKVKGINKVIMKHYNLENEHEVANMFDHYKRYIQGTLNYISMIRGKDDLLFQQFGFQYNELFNEDFFNCEKIVGRNTIIENRIVIISDINNDLSQGTGFFVKFHGVVYLLTSTHVVDIEGIEMYYYQHKNKTQKFNIDNKNINEFNKNTDLFIFETNSKYYFEVEENYDYNPLQEVEVIGYDEYYDGTESHTDILTQSVSKETIFKIKGCVLLKDNCIKHGMSGGPVLNRSGKVIGVNYHGAENSKSHFIPINRKILQSLIDNMNSSY